jgi:hypothetical protein
MVEGARVQIHPSMATHNVVLPSAGGYRLLLPPPPNSTINWGPSLQYISFWGLLRSNDNQCGYTSIIKTGFHL